MDNCGADLEEIAESTDTDGPTSLGAHRGGHASCGPSMSLMTTSRLPRKLGGKLLHTAHQHSLRLPEGIGTIICDMR